MTGLSLLVYGFAESEKGAQLVRSIFQSLTLSAVMDVITLQFQARGDSLEGVSLKVGLPARNSCG